MPKIQFDISAANGGGLTLWDLANPDTAAKAAVDVYGPAAVTAAAHCAFSAHFEGREDDYRFWYSVFRQLQGGTH